MQHVASNIHHATCSMQHSACSMQHAACSRYVCLYVSELSCTFTMSNRKYEMPSIARSHPRSAIQKYMAAPCIRARIANVSKELKKVNGKIWQHQPNCRWWLIVSALMMRTVKMILFNRIWSSQTWVIWMNINFFN